MSPETTPDLQRRRLLALVAAVTGAAVSPTVAAAVLNHRPTTSPGEPLRDDDLEWIGLLAEHILPRTDTPGALDAGVDRMIETWLRAYLLPEDATRFLQGLATFRDAANTALDGDFRGVTRAQQAEWLTGIDRAAFARDDAPHADFWREHKGLVLAAFFTSEPGQTEVLRRMPMGDWEADIPYDQVGRGWN